MQGELRGPEGSGVGIELWLECKMKLKIKEKKSDLSTWANLLTAPTAVSICAAVQEACTEINTDFLSYVG